MSEILNKKMQLLGAWYAKLQRISNNLNGISQKHELSFEQFLVLEQIIEEDRNSPSELAIFFKTSMPAVSRKLNILQAKKLIHKIRGEQEDQRLMWVTVTPEGNDIYEAIKHELLMWGDEIDIKELNLMADVNHYLSQINHQEQPLNQV